LLFVNGCDWKNQNEIFIFILVPVWDKCIDVLGTVLKNDGNQKEQRATRTEPDLLNILRNFTQILADAVTENVFVSTSFCVLYNTGRSECSPAPLRSLLEPHLVRRKFDLTIARTILQCSMTECCCVKGYSPQYVEVIRRVCPSDDTFSALFLFLPCNGTGS